MDNGFYDRPIEIIHFDLRLGRGEELCVAAFQDFKRGVW